MQAYKHRRGFLTTLALALAALAAFAGPASAHHHHGAEGGEPAGTIASYDPDSGMLTIDLAKGGSISATVTEDTRIELSGGCDKGEGERHGRKARHGRAHRAARHGSGGDHGRHHGWFHHGREGSTDDLTSGTVVDDAVIVLVDGTAVYAKVELETPHSGATS